MKRLTSGFLLLGAAVIAASCNNVTGDLAQGATRIVADPNPLSADTVGNATFLSQAYDDQGSPLVSNATVSSVSGPVTVKLDTAYQHNGVKYSTQFLVHGTALGLATWTVSDNGLSVQDTAFVLPPTTNLVGTVSALTPTMGDTLIVTTPAGEPYRFTDGTSLAFVGPITVANNQMHLVSIAPDGLSATFVVDGASFGRAIITGATLTYAARTGTKWQVATDSIAIKPIPVAALDVETDATEADDTLNIGKLSGTNLTWSRVRGVSPYRIERGLAAGGPFTLIDSTIKDIDTVFNDKGHGMVVGTTYFYRILACSNATPCAAPSVVGSAVAGDSL